MTEKPEKDPQLCERCGKEPATVHIRRISEGEEKEIHLCRKCALEMGIEVGATGETVTVDPVSLLFQNLEEAGTTEAVCPECGLRFSQFRETGRLGCPRCYAAFAEQLEPLLRRIHGATRHTGKKPKQESGKQGQASLLRRLSEELERAVGREDYERAAELRDRIREVEAGRASSEKQG